MTRIRPQIKKVLDQIVNDKLPGVEVLNQHIWPTSEELKNYPGLVKKEDMFYGKKYIINTNIIHPS